MAIKTDRLTIASCPARLRLGSSIKPPYPQPEDHARCGLLSRFASSICAIGLFLAAAFLISCNGVGISGGSSTSSSANSLRITTANHTADTNPIGDGGTLSDAVQFPSKRPTAANPFSFATPAQASVRPTPAGLQITTRILPAGTVQSDYDTALEATGGVPPYHWDATAGKIAPGLTLRSSTGTISGIPFAPGAFSFRARVQDSTGSSLSTTVSLNISTTAPAAVSDVVPEEGSVDGGRVVMISD